MIEGIIMQVLTLVIQVIIITLGGFIISYLKSKIGNEKLNQYYLVAKIVVNSIEQTLGSGNGKGKKEEAIQIIKDITKGKLSDPQIEKLIEATVYEMNTLLKINGIKEIK